MQRKLKQITKIALTSILSAVNSGDYGGRLYWYGLANDDPDSQGFISAMKTIAQEQLLSNAKLFSDKTFRGEAATNLSFDNSVGLTEAGKSLFNPLKLHGSGSQQIKQFLKSVDDNAVDSITGICYDDSTLPAAIGIALDENYISGLQKYPFENGFILTANPQVLISDNGYRFINMQQERKSTVNNFKIDHSNNTNIANGSNNSLDISNNLNIENRATQSLKELDDLAIQLSTDDQVILKEIRTDIERESVHPGKWQKFSTFFESHPNITSLIGNLLTASATIGSAFFNK